MVEGEAALGLHVKGRRDLVVMGELKTIGDEIYLTENGEGTDVFGTQLTARLSQT